MRRLALLLLTALSPAASASDWADPFPRLFSNVAGPTPYGFKVLPQPGQKVARAELFRVGANGDPVALWNGTLPNIPSTVYVSAFGQVVTLDTYQGDPRGQHALTIYSRGGRKLADYSFGEIVTDPAQCNTCGTMDGPFLALGFRPILDHSNGGRLLLKKEGGGGPLVSLTTGKILRR